MRLFDITVVKLLILLSALAFSGCDTGGDDGGDVFIFDVMPRACETDHPAAADLAMDYQTIDAKNRAAYDNAWSIVGEYNLLQGYLPCDADTLAFQFPANDNGWNPTEFFASVKEELDSRTEAGTPFIMGPYNAIDFSGNANTFVFAIHQNLFEYADGTVGAPPVFDVQVQLTEETVFIDGDAFFDSCENTGAHCDSFPPEMCGMHVLYGASLREEPLKVTVPLTVREIHFSYTSPGEISPVAPDKLLIGGDICAQDSVAGVYKVAGD